MITPPTQDPSSLVPDRTERQLVVASGATLPYWDGTSALRHAMTLMPDQAQKVCYGPGQGQ